MKIANSVSSRDWSFGPIPAEWQALPLKYLCSRSSLYGANVAAEAYENDGVRFLRTSDIRDDGTLNEGGVFVPSDIVADYMLSEEDFLISRSGTVGRAYIYRHEDGPCAYAGYLVRYVLQHSDSRRWLFYITKSPGFQQWLGAAIIEATIGNVNGEKYANLLVPVPPLPQQRAIADYLDRETALLDDLVGVKEHLLDLLVEKRNAIIIRAVTHGIDPNVPLRDSGIPWLGEIPAHWETERARWLFRERDERSDTGEEDLLTVSHLTGVTLRSEKDVNMFEAATKEGYKICLSGDLVINTMWAWMGAMGVSSLDGIVSPAYNVYEPIAHLDPSYVDALVRLPAFAQEVTRYSKGVWSSRLRLYPEGFFAVSLPVPPLSEQREIVAHIANETCKLDGLCDATKRTMELLKERRAALISAAVTGQIDMEQVAWKSPR